MEALDQRVRQLPLRTGKSDAVALERGRASATLAEILALPGKLGRPLHQHLDTRMARAALEARRPAGMKFRRRHDQAQYRHEPRIYE